MQVVHINYDAKVTDFKNRLETAMDSFRSGIQAQTLKVGNEALSVGKEALNVGNEIHDTQKLQS